MQAEPADICFSFDTTGSMFPCLTQVRRVVEQTTKELFKELPDLRIGVITHGDYCDGSQTITLLDLTSDQKKICSFINSAPATSGGDSPECYELALNKARGLSWGSGRTKALVLIGDDVPHPVGYNISGYGTGSYGTKNTLDWQNEAKLLVESGVYIYAVQALGRTYNSHFYNKLADISSTPKLDLAQFGQVPELLQAICYKQSNRLPEFEALLRAKAVERIDFSLLSNIDRLAGRSTGTKGTGSIYSKPKSSGLTPVHPSRFQILKVPTNYTIKDFVVDNGLFFKQGRGFYEFTKSEEVQERKEVILQDKISGEMFSGDDARRLIGLPFGTRGTVKPSKFEDKYRIFIQSTSNNRKLIGGTNFLYEVEGLV